MYNYQKQSDIPLNRTGYEISVTGYTVNIILGQLLFTAVLLCWKRASMRLRLGARIARFGIQMIWQFRDHNCTIFLKDTKSCQNNVFTRSGQTNWTWERLHVQLVMVCLHRSWPIQRPSAIKWVWTLPHNYVQTIIYHFGYLYRSRYV